MAIMVRLFMVSLVLISTTFLYAQPQNLLINGDFEDIVPSNGSYKKYDIDIFYCKDWYQPTECSVDIYRDFSACNNKHLYTMNLPFCVDAYSGNYCLGFIPITVLGYMEHLTGQLKQPLEKGKIYIVSYYIKFSSPNIPYIPNGIGFKLSQDSMLFTKYTQLGTLDKLCSPFYDDIFQNEKIYADFENPNYLIDTNWIKQEYKYVAKGGERFFTFGRFAYQNDAKIIKQLKKMRYEPYEDKIYKFLRQGKSLIVKDVLNKRKDKDFAKIYHHDYSDYYFIDNIQIIEQNE